MFVLLAYYYSANGFLRMLHGPRHILAEVPPLKADVAPEASTLYI